MAKKLKDESGKKPEVTTPAATEAAPAPQDAKRRPIQNFRVEDVSASVWSREIVVQGHPRTFHSVSFERSYKDANGQYRYSKSFDPESLGKVVSVAQKAAEYIHGLMFAEPEGSGS